MTSAAENFFLFSYFTNSDDGKSGMRLAVSDDGLTYRPINQGRPLLEPAVGESQLMRDPFVLADPNSEVYHLVWTTSWSGKTIGYASSPDLVRWSEQRSLPVMDAMPGVRNCWAPEIIHDPTSNQFVIFWSSTVVDDRGGVYTGTNIRDHRIYCVTTPDFITFSEPRLLFDPGFNVIDASFLRTADGLVLLIKDERSMPENKNIRWTAARSPFGPFGRISDPITKDWVEGPTAVRLGDETIVLFDQYRLGKYGAVATRDFEHWYDATDRISIPEGANHGSIMPINYATYLRLTAL
ncbi:glycoside hydrolase family 43 protein [Agrobacterium sp. rho-13.3]|jgi:hypothetical protein|uniref:glycoside hydrolase family 43 protein n=1 Tax=Agrobacterium sp. rho-13.3 TaxID=3072980 RepID=UPI002A1149EF|nr:glycoside hydrolase family 43 protein [Agrobacterium sp. rho-13.3]MDX8306291.1 glycoside hydrolase family 43 protein [Agrobacterium sp. rho-13.3]MDX8307378.1 glycoside hydrolase family 43 protein [Agrobacterium sp. rho-13.3]